MKSTKSGQVGRVEIALESLVECDGGHLWTCNLEIIEVNYFCTRANKVDLVSDEWRSVAVRQIAEKSSSICCL